MKRYLPLIPVNFQAPMHLYDFSPKVLKMFLEKSGYNDIKILIASPDKYSGMLTYVVVNNIKYFSRLIYVTTLGKYIFPLSGGLLGIGGKEQS